MWVIHNKNPNFYLKKPNFVKQAKFLRGVGVKMNNSLETNNGLNEDIDVYLQLGELFRKRANLLDKKKVVFEEVSEVKDEQK